MEKLVAPARRRRRTREDVTRRICEAARDLFAARGYHRATTNEIARLADVSETLLFRYYGSKAVLFDTVVAQPFNRLMQDFIAARPDNTDPKAQEHHIFTAVYELIACNRALFIALLSSKGGAAEEGGQPTFNGLRSFFEAGTQEQLQKYAARGEIPSFDMSVALRLAFGMLAASVLLRDWLFPEGAPSQDEMIAMLEGLVSRALDPVPVKSPSG